MSSSSITVCGLSQGPHGKSRANGSHALLDELVDVLRAPPT
jgi:hypothetical protein